MRTYDDWKTTDDTPEPEVAWCETCNHPQPSDDYCDCPCCHEPDYDEVCLCNHKLYLHDDGIRRCVECECKEFRR